MAERKKDTLKDIKILDGEKPIYKDASGTKYYVSYKTATSVNTGEKRIFLNIGIQTTEGKNPFSVSNFLKIPQDALVPVLDALKKMHSKYIGETEEETEDISSKKIVKDSNKRLQEQINEQKLQMETLTNLLSTLVKKKK